MTIQLLHRRQETDADPVSPELFPPQEERGSPQVLSDGSALEHLDRWIDGGEELGSTEDRDDATRAADRALLGGTAQRLGKGWVRMLQAEARKATVAKELVKDRAAAGARTRVASSRVARLFAEVGERKAALAFAHVPKRTLTHLAKELPARTEAHILEHTREIIGKPTHTLFSEGTNITEIVDLVRTTIRSGARPILSVSDNGALAFVFEKEFPKVIGRLKEKTLRVVVDLEGRIVTAFPVAFEKKLVPLSIRGISVSASVAPVFFLNALAEEESALAEKDTERRSAAQSDTWTERVLEFIGPYGLLESSPIAMDPNFRAIRERTAAALDEARASFGRELTPPEQAMIRRCVYNVWADAALQTTS